MKWLTQSGCGRITRSMRMRAEPLSYISRSGGELSCRPLPISLPRTAKLLLQVVTARSGHKVINAERPHLREALINSDATSSISLWAEVHADLILIMARLKSCHNQRFATRQGQGAFHEVFQFADVIQPFQSYQLLRMNTENGKTSSCQNPNALTAYFSPIAL